MKIKSEHVARVSDVGTLPNGSPYMVMEYLDGGDLAAWIKQRGALPVEQAVEFVLQACVAVADAHVLGIVLDWVFLSSRRTSSACGVRTGSSPSKCSTSASRRWPTRAGWRRGR